MNRKVIIVVSLVTAFFCIVFIKAGAQTIISDTEITNEIESIFYNDTALSAQLVDVHTRDGIVTLTGTVHNLLAEDRVIDIANSIKGVRGIIDKINIKAPHVQDTQLEQNVTNALQEDPVAEAFQMDVRANDGTVKLVGSVNSWQEKMLAEEVVKGVEGVTKVENELIFVWKKDRPDEEIKKEIEQRLSSDFRVDDGMIEVEVNNGHVKLTGVVGNSLEKNQAEIDAWVANVENVDASGLSAEPWAKDSEFIKGKYDPKTDLEVKKAVTAALDYDKRVNEFDIDVKVDSGIVTLSGTVDNLMARKSATKDARYVVGVLNVKNNIKVRPEETVESKALAENVEERINKDPFLSLYDINVYAANSKVMLSGRVSSAFEKMRAEIVAAKTKGVASVQNMLKVTGLYYHDFEIDALGAYTSYVKPRFDIADDLDIKRQIESQIWWSPYVDREEVDVEVKNGVATLTGMVDSRREKQYARLNAIEGGAQRVDNDLVVRERFD